MGTFDSRGGFMGRDREMHDAVCERCKKLCRVPFKPSMGRDVFCRECYSETRND